jgi:hypothetical protein
MKKTLIISSIVIGIFLILISIVPYIIYKNQDKITSEVIHDLNESFGFDLKVQRMYISPFKNFPYVSVDLDHIDLSNPNETDSLKKQIMSFDHIYVGFDLIELLKGHYDVKSVLFTNGRIFINRFSDGSNNLSFLMTDDETIEKEATHLDFNLKKIIFKNTKIIVDDSLKNQYYEVLLENIKTGIDYDKENILNHIEGDLIVELMAINGVKYFQNKHINIVSDIEYLNEKSYLDVNPSKITIEGGTFNLEGGIDIANDNYFDLKLNGKKSNFDLLIAFTSPDIQEFMKSYKNEGDVYFIGSVLGHSNETSTPRIDIEFGCKNASFLNPSSNKSIEELNFKGYFSNGDKQNLETTSILIENLSGVPEKSIFKGSFGVQNFLQPKVFLDFHTKLYLDAVYDLYPLEFIEKMTGYLAIDLTLDEFVYIDSMEVSDKFSKIQKGSDSKIVMKNVTMKMKDYPIPLKKVNAEIVVEDGIINIKRFVASILDNDIKLQAKIDNVFAFLHDDQREVKINGVLSSNKIDLKELMLPISKDKNQKDVIDEQITDLQTEFKITTTNSSIYHFDSLRQAKIDIKSLAFNTSSYAHRIDKFNAIVDIKDDDINLKELHFNIDNNHLDGHFYLKNILAIGGEENKRVNIDFDLSSPSLNLHDLLMFKGNSPVAKGDIAEEFKNIFIKGNFSANSKELSDSSKTPNFNLKIEETKIDFVKIPKKIQHFSGTFDNNDDEFSFKNTKIRFANADFYLNGYLKNFFDTDSTNDLIVANLNAELVDLNEIILPFLSNKIEESEKAGEPYNIFSEVFPNLVLKSDVKKFKYDKFLMENIVLDTKIDPNHVIKLNRLSMDAAEGHLDLKGVLDGSDKDNLFLKSDMDLKNLCLEKIFFKFDNFGQESMVQENIKGYLTAKINCTVPLKPDLSFDLKEVDAVIDAKIRDGNIINFEPFLALDNYLGFRDLSNVKFAEMENKFTLKHGKITIPKMTINSSLGYMIIDGTKTVDQYMDFQVQIPSSLVKRAATYSLFNKANSNKKDENRKEDEIIYKTENGSLAYVFVHVLGHIDDFKVNMGKRKK